MKHEARQKHRENAGADRGFLAQKPYADVMKPPAQRCHQSQGKCAHFAARQTGNMKTGQGRGHRTAANVRRDPLGDAMQTRMADVTNKTRLQKLVI